MIATPTRHVQIEPGSAEVRRSTLADRQALVEMYLGFEPKGAAFGLPPRKEPETWLDHLTPYPNFVAWVAGRVVEHSVLCPEDDLGEVAVFVHQDYRQRGLGKKLVRELVQEAQRLGLRKIWGWRKPIISPCSAWHFRWDSLSARTRMSFISISTGRFPPTTRRSQSSPPRSLP